MSEQSLKRLSWEGSSFKPTIELDPDTGILEFSGESFHEYTGEFYQPIFEWLDTYLKEPKMNVMARFKMTYFDTASSKCLYEIVQMIADYEHNGQGTSYIQWYYEEDDPDMLETGKDFAEDSQKDLKFISY